MLMCARMRTGTAVSESDSDDFDGGHALGGAAVGGRLVRRKSVGPPLPPPAAFSSSWDPRADEPPDDCLQLEWVGGFSPAYTFE